VETLHKFYPGLREILASTESTSYPLAFVSMR